MGLNRSFGTIILSVFFLITVEFGAVANSTVFFTPASAATLLDVTDDIKTLERSKNSASDRKAAANRLAERLQEFPIGGGDDRDQKREYHDILDAFEKVLGARKREAIDVELAVLAAKVVAPHAHALRGLSKEVEDVISGRNEPLEVRAALINAGLAAVEAAQPDGGEHGYWPEVLLSGLERAFADEDGGSSDVPVGQVASYLATRLDVGALANKGVEVDAEVSAQIDVLVLSMATFLADADLEESDVSSFVYALLPWLEATDEPDEKIVTELRDFAQQSPHAALKGYEVVSWLIGVDPEFVVEFAKTLNGDPGAAVQARLIYNAVKNKPNPPSAAVSALAHFVGSPDGELDFRFELAGWTLAHGGDPYSGIKAILDPEYAATEDVLPAIELLYLSDLRRLASESRQSARRFDIYRDLWQRDDTSTVVLLAILDNILESVQDRIKESGEERLWQEIADSLTEGDRSYREDLVLRLRAAGVLAASDPKYAAQFVDSVATELSRHAFNPKEPRDKESASVREAALNALGYFGSSALKLVPEIFKHQFDEETKRPPDRPAFQVDNEKFAEVRIAASMALASIIGGAGTGALDVETLKREFLKFFDDNTFERIAGGQTGDQQVVAMLAHGAESFIVSSPPSQAFAATQLLIALEPQLTQAFFKGYASTVEFLLADKGYRVRAVVASTTLARHHQYFPASTLLSIARENDAAAANATASLGRYLATVEVGGEPWSQAYSTLVDNLTSRDDKTRTAASLALGLQNGNALLRYFFDARNSTALLEGLFNSLGDLASDQEVYESVRRASSQGAANLLASVPWSRWSPGEKQEVVDVVSEAFGSALASSNVRTQIAGLKVMLALPRI